jgi:curved DNA-binding protein CbpA
MKPSVASPMGAGGAMRLGRDGSSTGSDRVPRLAADCDPARLHLTPAEGYLLSRIDGATPLSLLRQIGGLPAAEVDRCLERLAKEGAVVWDALASGGAPLLSEPPPAAAPLPPVSPEIDPSLDLPVEMQQRVIEFEALLGQPYHVILGVARDADLRTIKQAYFGLSKQFHPDRYFRRNLGPYAVRVESIFKKVLEAYELLSDPATRAEVQRDLTSGPDAVAAAPEPAAAAPPSTAPPSDPAAARRLRARLTALGRHRRVLDERKRKAKSFFESGMAAFKKERWLEAAGSVRLAIAFDPVNEIYRSAFADVQRRAHEERARTLLKEADGAYQLGDYRDALRLYEEALHYRAFDPELSHKTGWLAWKLGTDLRKAKEYAVAACELAPDNAVYRRTLGHVYKAAGLTANAKREFQAAIRLDPGDAEAKQELKTL